MLIEVSFSARSESEYCDSDLPSQRGVLFSPLSLFITFCFNVIFPASAALFGSSGFGPGQRFTDNCSGTQCSSTQSAVFFAH